MTPQEWLNKANWEGGIFAGLEYGLKASDLDDSDEDFMEHVKALEVRFGEYAKFEENLLDYAEECGYEVDE